MEVLIYLLNTITNQFSKETIIVTVLIRNGGKFLCLYIVCFSQKLSFNYLLR
jgi:hypothetical protein